MIINNTSNHIERLQIKFERKNVKEFLLSTRFLFQNLERVQFFDLKGDLIADTNVLDLDQSVFTKSEIILEENLISNNSKQDLSNINNNLTTNIEEKKNNVEIKKLISKKNLKRKYQ